MNVVLRGSPVSLMLGDAGPYSEGRGYGRGI
jgi:hypothetical protein